MAQTYTYYSYHAWLNLESEKICAFESKETSGMMPVQRTIRRHIEERKTGIMNTKYRIILV